MELHSLGGVLPVPQSHDDAIVGLGRHLQTVGQGRSLDDERVVPRGRQWIGKTAEEALAVAQEIATKKPGSVSHIKRLLGKNDAGLSARLEAERDHFVRQIATEEARHGIKAYMEGKIK